MPSLTRHTQDRRHQAAAQALLIAKVLGGTLAAFPIIALAATILNLF